MNTDSLGAIFRAEKKLGRGDLFELITHFSDGRTKISRFQHEFHDGLGAMLEESQSWTGAPFVLPAFKLKSPKTLGAIVDGLRGLLDDLQPSMTHWKRLNRDAPYSPINLAWIVFSQSSSATLRAFAKKNKVSLNTLLLFATNAVISRNLLEAEQESCRWLIPVNMRKTPKERNSTSNHTSSFGLNLNRSADLWEIESCYRVALNSWRVLSAYAIARAAGMLPEDLLLMLAKQRGEKNFWVGSFSNLGVWTAPSTPNHHSWPAAVCIAPPAGTPCFPVGVGVITWQNSLSLALRLHPGLVADDTKLPERMLAEIRQQLSQTVCDELEFTCAPSSSTPA